MLRLFTLLLCVIMLPLQSQEPLWRKGGSFHLLGPYDKDIRSYNNIGLHYKGKEIYTALVNTNTIEKYDSATLVRSMETVPGIIAEASPHCKMLILQDANLMRLYDVKKRSVFFERVDIHKVLAFSHDSRFTLFDDGSLHDWNDTLDHSPIKLQLVLNNIGKYADWSNDGKVLIWGYQDSIRIYDAINKSDTYITYPHSQNSTFRFSTNGKAIVNFNGTSYTLFTVENGTTNIISKDDDAVIGSDYHFLNDTLLIILKSRNKKNADFLLYNLISKNIVSTISIASSSIGSSLRFLKYDTSIVKNAIPLISYEPSYCGGDPVLTNGILHFLNIDYKPSLHSVPNRLMECVRGICFMEGDTTVATVNCSNTIIITGIRDGKIKRQWDIPKHVYASRTLLGTYAWVNNQLLTSGEYLIFPSGNMLYRFSVQKGKLTDSIKVSDSVITFITHSRDKKHILTSADKTVYIYNSENFNLIKNFEYNQKVSNVSLNNDTLLCALAGSSQIYKTLFSSGMSLLGYTIQGTYPILSFGGHSAAPSPDSSVVLLDPPLKLKHPPMFFKYWGWTSLKRIINVDKLWLIVHTVPEILGVPGSTSIALYKESNNSLLEAHNNRIYSSCNGKNAFVSDNGKHCASISTDGKMELYEINFVPVSVHDNEQETITENEQGYSVTEDYMYIYDNKNYTVCTMYNITGENMGTCLITNNEGITRITIPHTIQNGFYNMLLHSNKGVISKRIVLNR